ncbi:MAG: thiamine diphosphokinase [Chlamydiota bacterium]
MIERLLTSYRSALLLNGKHLGHRLLGKIRDDAPVIAADGAAKWHSADYIVGDLDSFSVADQGQAEVIPISDQDRTDCEKGMVFAKEKKLLPCLILGLSGGEIDHFLGNIQALLKHANSYEFFFLDEYEKGVKIGIPLSEGKYPIETEVGATVSVFPHRTCKLTTNGLFWELKEESIDLDGPLTVRNRSTKGSVEFNMIEGKALIVIDIGLP